MNNDDYDLAPILVLPPSAALLHIGSVATDLFSSTMEIGMNMEPSRARAVFSTEDFSLIREAVAYYLQENKDGPDSIKFAHLYHRLGRVAPKRP